MNMGKCPRIGEVLKKPQLAALTFLLLYIAFLPRAEPALFGPKGDSAGEKRGNVRKQRDEVMQDLFTSNPKLKSIVSGAEGYATFKATDMKSKVRPAGMGMVSMRERVKQVFGSMEIHSKIGDGTQVEVIVPLLGKTAT